MGLRDWVSEKAPQESHHGQSSPLPSMGLRDWVSEKARPFSASQGGPPTTFNGAPRLGLGEGKIRVLCSVALVLPSMGLRDWVSEKVA